MPPGNRSEAIRGRAATVQDASQPGIVCDGGIPASSRIVRLHDVPRGTGSRDQFPKCRAHAAERRTAKTVGKEVWLARGSFHRYADATDDEHRGRLLQVSQWKSGSSQSCPAQQRTGYDPDLWMLRLPQDSGL